MPPANRIPATREPIDDVTDAKIFGRDGYAEGRAGKPCRTIFRLRGPSLHSVHQERVGATEPEPPEDASREGPAAFACNEYVRARRAFGKHQVAMFLDDELAPQRHHEKDAKPSAKQRERENSPEGEFRAEAEKDQRGNCKHHASSERFSRRAGGLHDVVFQNCGASERAQDADGENGDRNGGGDGEACAQSDVNGDGAKEQSEERAKYDGANREFLERFFRRDIGTKFSRRRRGTPRTVGD